MSYNRIDISEGWQLGWCRETQLNRWVQNFGEWEVRDGALHGYRGNARIYENTPLPDNYTFTCDFTLAENSAFQFGIGFSLIRLSYYVVGMQVGGASWGGYAFSDMYEGNDFENAGPVLEAGQSYRFRCEVKDGEAEYFVDDTSVARVSLARPRGDRVLFTVLRGDVYFKNVLFCDADGDPVFEDDFSADSLMRRVPVKLEDLQSEEWIPAKIPGSVHTSLLAAGKIEDPYVGYNGPKQLWIDDQRWIYKKTFTVPEGWKDKRAVRLVFGGVDYHGYFWVNGVALGYHEGMLGGPDLDITPYLDFEGENEIVVCILPCPNPPSHNVRPYIFGRWHFNMDILPVGIWRPVELVARENIIVSEPQVITRSVSDDGTAHLDIGVTVASIEAWPFEAKVTFTLTSPDPDDAPVEVSAVTGFSQGAIRLSMTADIPNAKLWWPNGLGDQPLYNVDVVAELKDFNRGGEITGHDEMHFTTGIRTLEMKPSPNKNAEYNWVFCVNGRDFFGKGSNWMPTDQMLDITTEKYEHLLTLAKESNINILRPWGAGLIETDEFYNICDRLGICVWQEMLMANNEYDKIDRNVWRDTITENVLRIRNHPSLVMWCGGNEFNADDPFNRDIVDDMANICRELDPTRDFHRASPYGGDNHSYQVNWMEGMYYPRYTTDRSVAVTEFSMASPPVMDTMKRLVPEEELKSFPPDLPDEVGGWNIGAWGDRQPERKESGFSMHDAHLSSITRIMFNPMSDVGIPHNWEEYIRYTQTAHGMLTQFGEDYWRSRWPYCTLSMSWVYNVVFPSTMSWAYVDGYGIPKRSYYYQKRAYETLHVCASFDDLFTRPGETFTARLSVVSEKLESYRDAHIVTRLYDSDFALIKSDDILRNIEPDRVTSGGFFTYEIPVGTPDACLFLVVDLVSAEGELLSRSQYCPRIGQPSRRAPYIVNGPWIADAAKNTTALEARVTDSEKNEKGETVCRVAITVTGEKPAFTVGIEAPDHERQMRYSDNFFWMEPGETRTVTVTIADDTDRFFVKAWNSEAVSVSL